MVKKINVGNGVSVDLTPEETAVVGKYEKGKEVIELGALEGLAGKAKGEKEVAVFAALQKRADEAYDAAEKAKAEKPETPAGETKPEAPTTGPLKPSDVFNTGGGTAPVTSTAQAAKGGAKTEEERNAQKLRREQKANEDKELTQKNLGMLDEQKVIQEGIIGAEDAKEALKDLILINNRVPLYKTLVSSDTRLRATVKNLIKPADREYHPMYANEPGQRATGKDIPLKKSKGLYELELVESNPSPPRGFFIFVPKSLMDLNIALLSSYNERQKIVKAVESFESDKERTIKLFHKEDFVKLLVLLGDPIVQEYNCNNKDTDDFVETAPIIRLHMKKNTKTAGASIYTLKATLGGVATKLSIRNFIPLQTHDTTTVNSKDHGDGVLLTQVLFHNLVFKKPTGYPANKYDQMTDASKLKFDLTNEDKRPRFTEFANHFTVKAYDSKGGSGVAQMVRLPLPKVEMSNPTSGTSKPRFKKSKHNEEGGNYQQEYIQYVQRVGDQIEQTKPRSTASLRDTSAQKLAIFQAQNQIFKGNPIDVR